MLINKLTAGIHKINIVKRSLSQTGLDAARYWHQVYDLGPLMIANKFELTSLIIALLLYTNRIESFF